MANRVILYPGSVEYIRWNFTISDTTVPITAAEVGFDGITWYPAIVEGNVVKALFAHPDTTPVPDGAIVVPHNLSTLYLRFIDTPEKIVMAPAEIYADHN